MGSRHNSTPIVGGQKSPGFNVFAGRWVLRTEELKGIWARRFGRKSIPTGIQCSGSNRFSPRSGASLARSCKKEGGRDIRHGDSADMWFRRISK
jgi:hypothetical protein